MERYLIESPHDVKDCQFVIGQVYAMGYLHNFDWGCKDGVHSGWAIIEAENEADARLAVPSIVRMKARVVRLVKFDSDPVMAQQTHDGLAKTK
jgi:hypothetical protein